MNKQTSFVKPLVIIPAAGFGRRVGAPNSKEVLQLDYGQPLIERAFSECESRDWPMHLLTRPEKTDLLAYCHQRKLSHLAIQSVQPTREWPETVLLSEPFWLEWNLLFLPDLLFQPSNILDQIMAAATGSVDFIAAGQATDRPQIWGCLRSEASGFAICEKPQGLESSWAWGFLAFRKKIGRQLFESLLESGSDHKWKSFSFSSQIFELTSMSDPTR